MHAMGDQRRLRQSLDMVDGNHEERMQRVASRSRSTNGPQPSQKTTVPHWLPPAMIEFIGTFFLVLTATIVSGVLAPFAVGSILMVMVFMGGTISGGVYNPAVTLALMLRGELPVARAIRYAIVQLVAGIAAGLVGNVMAHVPGSTDACPLVVDNVMRAIVAETVYTCMLCYVVLSVATVGEGNHFFGLAIGMSVGSGAMLVGSVSGGVFNPAVGTGISVGALIHGCKTISHLYIYWIGPLLGAVIAAGLFRITNHSLFLKDGQKPGCCASIAAALMESIGTFYLVHAVALSGLAGNLGALAVGTSLMVNVFAGGHISGGQYNPAVTTGIWVRAAQSTKTTLVFWAVQILASVLAAGLGHYIAGGGDHPVFPAPGKGFSWAQAFLAELLFTFALVTTVLHTGTAMAQDDNSYFGLAIGFTVFAGAQAVGGISGGAFNPAVGTGTTVVAAFVNGASALKHLWIYWAAPLLGGILAGLVFRVTNSAEIGEPNRGEPVVGLEEGLLDGEEDGVVQGVVGNVV